MLTFSAYACIQYACHAGPSWLFALRPSLNQHGVYAYACIWYACLCYVNSMKIQRIVSRSVARRPATVDSDRFSVSFYGFKLSCLIFCWFSVGFVTPRTSWGSSEGPRRALGGLGSSPGRFWDLLGRPGGVPGRRPIITFRRQIRYKSWGFGAWAIFSDVKGRLDFVCCFIVFRSLVFVNRGGEFIVKHLKIEGFEFGQVRIC